MIRIAQPQGDLDHRPASRPVTRPTASTISCTDTGVPVLSVSLTPHHFQPTEHHISVFAKHFVEKGREAAQAALMIGKTRAALAA